MRISVVGLGKLGSPIAAVFAAKGYDVIGIDTNPVFVEKINNHVAPVEEPGLQELLTEHKARILPPRIGRAQSRARNDHRHRPNAQAGPTAPSATITCSQLWTKLAACWRKNPTTILWS